ncbi:phthiocerol/phthiodiolone dimycocerosyl transferase family protein [Micromonospora rubida]
MTAADHGRTGEVRRPLSPMERWYWICDQLSPLNVVARVRVAGAYRAEDLRRAAARLAREHPLLRVAVAAEPDGGRPRFVAARAAGLPVRAVRADGPDADRWAREVDEVELATPLDRRAGPLARIVDVARGTPGTADERHDLILTVSHVVADGTTALELLRRLVELAAGEATPGAPAGSAPPRAPVPPAEALLPGRLNGVPRAAHLVAAVLADRVAAIVARPWRLAPAVPLAPTARRTRLVRRELDAGQLAALVDRCRRERVTVHGALAAALATAVAGTEPHLRPRRVCVGSPVDFRAELVPPVDRRDAGAYVATVPSYLRVGPAVDLWTVARAAFRDLRRRRRLHHHLALVSLLRLMSPRSVGASARAVALVDRAGPGNVCLSNVGRFDFPARVGSWELSGAQFVAGVSVSGYLVATVNTSHAALHWNFTYIDGAVTGERAGRIADEAVRALLSSLRRDGTPLPTGTGGRS